VQPSSEALGFDSRAAKQTGALSVYQQPMKGDLDRNLSTILHDAHQKARAESARMTSEFAARGMAQSPSLISATIGVLDIIHKDAIGQAMPLLRDFVERMKVAATEVASIARPHLENMGNSVLGQLPPARFPAEHARVRTQYTLVFQQRLDGALRDFEIGFIAGRSVQAEMTVPQPASGISEDGADNEVVRIQSEVAETQNLTLRPTEPTASTAPKVVELSARRSAMVKGSGVLTLTATVPDQSLAPVVVEERNYRIARVNDLGSPLSATEQDFNGWREPILDHVQELLSGDFHHGTNHSRVRDRLLAIGQLFPGDIDEVKERQFRIGYEIERFGGLLVAYRSGADDMPALSAAVFEDLDRLHIALVLGIDKLERWAKFRNAASDDPMQEGDADPFVISEALDNMADEMQRQSKYFDPDLPETFRFLAEANKDPLGATKAVVYGGVKSAENVLVFLARRALGIAGKAIDAVQAHISKAIAAFLITGLSGAALKISGSLPAGWAWLKPLLEALKTASGG
jgi:hypothetical protein